MIVLSHGWQATEDQILELMDALGSVISYVREDELLQLSAALFSEDLSAAHLGADVSAGVSSSRRCSIDSVTGA